MLARSLSLATASLLSGTAALIFESIWFRQAGLVFGNGVWASSLVLATFMGGLALGNRVARIRALGAVRPAPLYAATELTIAATGILVSLSLPSLAGLIAPLFRGAGSALVLNALRIAFCGLALLVPSTAMGVTLPALVQLVRRRSTTEFGAALGWVYGANTAGALGGLFVLELVLIDRLGIERSALFAAAANVVAALLALAAGRHASTPDARRLPAPAPALALRLAAGLCGAIFLALEVVWFRFLGLFMMQCAASFAAMLGSVLIGIAAGGFLGAALARRAGHAAAVPTALGCALAVVVSYVLFPAEPAVDSLDGMLRLSLALIAPSAIGSGLLFTLIGGLMHEGHAGDDREITATLTFSNTLGAMVGALLGCFFFIPVLGVERSFQALAVGYVGVAALLGRWGSRRRLLAAAALVLVAVAAVLPAGQMRRRFLPTAIAPWTGPDTEVVATREGPIETATLVRGVWMGEPWYHRLLTNSFSMSGSYSKWRRYMQLFVYLPAALHGAPRDALLISFGVGETASALVSLPSLRTIDVVDTSRTILDLSDLLYPPARHPLHDPRVAVHVEDGRFFLQTTTRAYDLITGEPPPPRIPVVASLYTREYFALARSRLRPGGLMSYWLPVFHLEVGDAKAIIRAFCDVFPDCSLWNGMPSDLILLGSREPRPPVSDPAALWRDPRVARLLADIGVEAPEQLYATFVGDGAFLAALGGDQPPLVDDFPYRIRQRANLASVNDGRVGWVRALVAIDACAARFAGSSEMAALLPAAFRADVLPMYRYQAYLNQVLEDIVLSPGVTPWPRYATELFDTLTTTRFVTLPLWLLGDSSEKLDIARRHEPDAQGFIDWTRGDGALVERRYDDAISAYERSLDKGNRSPYVFAGLMLARCLRGEPLPFEIMPRELTQLGSDLGPLLAILTHRCAR
jgi:spermidine synthase